MAQALGETIFDVFYLTWVIVAGFIMFYKSDRHPLVRKFGIMAMILGFGDAFHLVPRIIALWSGNMEAHAAMLGIGKLVTSITMTFFYLILYYIWLMRYRIWRRPELTVTMWALTLLRIGLCLLPQNEWTSYEQPFIYGIVRNVPFVIIGLLIIILFAQQIPVFGDRSFKHIPLAVGLSFAFYIPVVLFADTIPAIGMLMIPKTLAYAWIVAMGWKFYRKSCGDIET